MGSGGVGAGAFSASPLIAVTESSVAGLMGSVFAPAPSGSYFCHVHVVFVVYTVVFLVYVMSTSSSYILLSIVVNVIN